MSGPSAFPGALSEAHRRALDYLTTLQHRPVGVRATHARLRQILDGPVPEEHAAPERVVAALADACEPGLVGSAGDRYFGFVIGGATRRPWP